MNKKTFSLTSDKKALIVSIDGIEAGAYIPGTLQRQIDSINRQLEEQTKRSNDAKEQVQILLDKYNELAGL